MVEESGSMTLPTVTAKQQAPDSPADPNGKAASLTSSSPNHAASHLPRARRMGRGTKLLLAFAVLLLAAGGATAAYLYVLRPTGPREDLLTHKVGKEKLRVTIVERGT